MRFRPCFRAVDSTPRTVSVLNFWKRNARLCFWCHFRAVLADRSSSRPSWYARISATKRS